MLEGMAVTILDVVTGTGLSRMREITYMSPDTWAAGDN